LTNVCLSLIGAI